MYYLLVSVIITLIWFLYAFATVLVVRAEEKQRGAVPSDVSVYPLIPVAPVLSCVVYVALNHLARYAGDVVVLSVCGVALMTALILLAQSFHRLYWRGDKKK